MAAGRRTRFTAEEAADLVFAESSDEEDDLDELFTPDEFLRMMKTTMRRTAMITMVRELSACPQTVMETKVVTQLVLLVAQVVLHANGLDRLDHPQFSKLSTQFSKLST